MKGIFLRLRRVALLASTLSLAACGVLHEVFHADTAGCAGPPDQALGMQLDLVREQMQAGKYHAALAYLDTLDPRLPAAQLMRARASRQTGDTGAAGVAYQALLGSCLRAYGEQGLGLIAADRRDIAAAIDHLKKARELAPVDPEIRNDYGFALLAGGFVDAALREFRTAVELAALDANPRDGTGAPVAADRALAARNLVLALFIAQRADEAQAAARQYALEPEEAAALARRAANYHPLTHPIIPSVETSPHAPT